MILVTNDNMLLFINEMIARKKFIMDPILA